MVHVSNDEVQLQGYTNSNWEESVEDRKSTSGLSFSLYSAMISWMGKKQTSIALRTVDLEYIAVSLVRCEAVWLQKLFAGFLISCRK